MLTVVLLLMVAFTQFAISLGILLESRRTKQKAQRIFVALSTATFLWTLVNTVLIYVDKYGNSSNLSYFNFANKAGFLLGALSLLLIYVFSLNYPEPKKIQTFQKLIIGLGVGLMSMTFFDFISGTFTIEASKPIYHNGSLSVIFAFFALLVVFATYADNAKLLRTTKDILLRKQARTLLTGLTLTILHAVVFILILPPYFNESATVYALGYLAPYYFISSTIYSLIKQKLFDVRLIIARTVAYLMVLASIAAAFTAVLFVASANLFNFQRVPIAQQIIFVIASLTLALTFQPLKRFFDRLTNRFFYQDAYEPQKFLDEINRVFVSTIELEPLLRQSAAIIEENLKAEFCLVGLKETEFSQQRLIGNGRHKFNEKDILYVRAKTPHIHQKIIVVDELDSSKVELKQILSENEIAVLGRLVTDTVHTVEGIGYLILGPKKSGNPYNKQDIAIIEIIVNELVIAIQNALRFEEIQAFNATLQHKINEATKNLRNVNEKLKALDESKDEFISMASHQLRTPLTSVKGYLSMVIEGDAGKLNKMQRELLDQAYGSSQRMVYLIADLLNVSRLKTGKFVIEAVPTNLADVVEGELQQLTETAKARNLELVYNKPKDFPLVMLDETKIRQVIMNFADNAIYYTPSGGHIHVELEDKGSTIEFRVVDDGLGVPRHEQHHLFGKFYRAGNARKARPDGTGLGLFMAKKVVVAQGGSIIFRSEEGKGSTFGFSFAKEKLQSLKVKG